jgi:hypothetical protein
MVIPSPNPYHGKYFMASKDNGKRKQEKNERILLRMGHPLVQCVVQQAKSCATPCHEVVFDYSQSPEKVAYIEQHLLGRNGWMHVERLSIDSFEQEDHLLISCFTDNFEAVPEDISKRLLTLFATENKDIVKIPTEVIHQYNDDINACRADIVEESGKRNQNFFDEEMDKLDTWADDMKISLDREIRDLDAEIKLRKGEAKKLTRLAEKVAIQRQIKDLESKRKEKRQNLYEAQD